MITIAEAAERMGVTTLTVRRLIRRGKLPAMLVSGKHGPTWEITEQDLWRYQNPDTQVFELVQPAGESPLDVVQGIREGMTTLRGEFREYVDQQQAVNASLLHHLAEQQEEMAGLRQALLQAIDQAQQQQPGFWQRLFSGRK